jgi:hypothetical protein
VPDSLFADQPTYLPAENIENPYWDIVKDLPHDPLGQWSHRRFSPRAYPELARFADDDFLKKYPRLNRDGTRFTGEDAGPNRNDMVKEYAFAIPSPDSLNWIANHLNGRPIWDVGAGRGYWSWMLWQMGVEVTAYDSAPPTEGRNGYFSYKNTVESKEFPDGRVVYTEKRVRDLTPHQYFPITKPKGLAYLRNPGNAVLFLCWPPYGSSMADRILQAYKGDTFIYIGEGEGGCTGDDAFFARLENHWVEVDYDPNFVSWSMIHDRLEIYARK